jgi:serine O-acetyltransferase
MALRDWLSVRPAPAAINRTPRVKMTPPSPDPRGLLEYLEFIKEDIEAVLQNDPAARHALEVILVYPGLHAIWMHRLTHAWWKRGGVLGPRLIAHFNRFLTGIEIHPGAKFGRKVFIDHGMGIVVGETATVGDECLIYKGALLGGTSLERAERHPTLGKGVVVGTNASILGPIHIGDGAKIGSGSVVVKDVPDGATVVGVPGKLAQQRRKAPVSLDHADLPDPVAALLNSLMEEIEHLRSRVAQLESVSPLAGREDEHSAFTGPGK